MIESQNIAQSITLDDGWPNDYVRSGFVNEILFGFMMIARVQDQLN